MAVKQVSVDKNGGLYKGVPWSLRWTRTGSGPLIHTVTLTEGDQRRTCYQGRSHDDARNEFIAEQGKHFDDRKRR